MSAPRQSRRRTGRTYVWPPTPPHEFEVPSTTTILERGLAKPALAPWAARLVAEYAATHCEAWRHLPTEDAIDLLRKAPYRTRDRKAEIGSAVHAAINAYVEGVSVLGLTDAQAGYYSGALAFLREHEPRVVRSEFTVYSRTHGYAGTSDLLLRIGARQSIADFKTSKAIYPDVALQLVSYARADFIGTNDGEEISLPGIDEGIIVRLTPDGSYEAQRAELGDDVWDAFLAVKTLYEWAENTSRNVLSDLRLAS